MPEIAPIIQRLLILPTSERRELLVSIVDEASRRIGTAARPGRSEGPDDSAARELTVLLADELLTELFEAAPRPPAGIRAPRSALWDDMLNSVTGVDDALNRPAAHAVSA